MIHVKSSSGTLHNSYSRHPSSQLFCFVACDASVDQLPLYYIPSEKGCHFSIFLYSVFGLFSAFLSNFLCEQIVNFCFFHVFFILRYFSPSRQNAQSPLKTKHGAAEAAPCNARYSSLHFVTIKFFR